ncbi:hypothetical protein ACP70R_020059 [Stipagrostis hirtigluma subsp. patula]
MKQLPLHWPMAFVKFTGNYVALSQSTPFKYNNPLLSPTPSHHFHRYTTTPQTLLNSDLVLTVPHNSSRFNKLLVAKSSAITMGNCLVIQDRKEIKIMRVDGSKVINMPSPSLEVRERSFAEPLPDHGVSGVLPVKAPAVAVTADPGGVRVKLVISKQELKKMLDKEGMSLDDMVSLMRKEAIDDRGNEEECCGGWRPALESIPEGTEIPSSC